MEGYARTERLVMDMASAYIRSMTKNTETEIVLDKFMCSGTWGRR